MDQMETREEFRDRLRDKKRIVVKIGSSSLQHPETGDLDYTKLDVLVREICDMRNKGKDVVLVTSGAIAVGKKAVHMKDCGRPGEKTIAEKQACAAVGQARLMMIYQKIFAEYNQVAAQILMTKNTIVDNLNRYNAHNTFSELFKLGVVPIVNENDTVATYEIEFGDNDSLSAIVAALVAMTPRPTAHGRIVSAVAAALVWITLTPCISADCFCRLTCIDVSALLATSAV